MADITREIREIIKLVGQVLFVILLLIIGYQMVRAILGGTWATENIIIGALGIIIAGLFVIVGFLINQGNSIGVLMERTQNLGNSLKNLGEDFKEHVNRK